MPVGSLPAFNLLGGEEAQRKESEKREAARKANEKSGFSQMTGLWEHATGKTEKDGEKKGEKKGDKGGLVPQVGNLWDSATGNNRREKAKEKDSFRFFGRNSKKKSGIDWGPGGALGIGCGVGVGVGLTGGAGIGATPWSSLRIVFGVGAGCGIGVGYGYGYGMGLRWDKPLEQVPKRVVIEL